MKRVLPIALISVFTIVLGWLAAEAMAARVEKIWDFTPEITRAIE